MAREQGNPTFHFLKPTHSLFGYFKDLCDAYSRTLMPDKKLLGRLKQDAADRTGLLERCLKRLEWEKQRDAADKAASDKAEAERIAMQSIDWSALVRSLRGGGFGKEKWESPDTGEHSTWGGPSLATMK